MAICLPPGKMWVCPVSPGWTPLPLARGGGLLWALCLSPGVGLQSGSCFYLCYATLLGGFSFLPSQSRVTPTPHFTQFCIVNFPCLNYSVVFVSRWICNWEKTINSWGGKKYEFENLKNQCWNIFFMGLSIWFLRVLSSAPFAKTAL